MIDSDGHCYVQFVLHGILFECEGDPSEPGDWKATEIVDAVACLKEFVDCFEDSCTDKLWENGEIHESEAHN